MTQNLHVCTICFRPEVVYDVISGLNIKTSKGSLVIKFEVPIYNSLRDIPKKHHLVTAAAAEAADIDDSIKRKRIRVSLKKYHIQNNTNLRI